jgi:hypothetical protein
MRLELKRNALLIIPEGDQDQAFIEDSLGLKANGASLPVARINNVTLGYADNKAYVLKIESNGS